MNKNFEKIGLDVKAADTFICNRIASAVEAGMGGVDAAVDDSDLDPVPGPFRGIGGVFLVA